MTRTERSIKSELTKVGKLRKRKSNSEWCDAELSGAVQALAWVLRANAMSPSKVGKLSSRNK